MAVRAAAAGFELHYHPQRRRWGLPRIKKEKTPDRAAWFEGTMKRIHEVCFTRTQVELAEALGVRQSSISDAKRRCSIPAEWQLTILNERGVDPRWLTTGEGPKFRVLSDDPQGGAVSVSALERQVAERLELELSAEGITEKFFAFHPRAVVVMAGPEIGLDQNALSKLPAPRQ